MKSCPACSNAYAQNFSHCPRDGTVLVEAGAWTEGTVVRGKYRILGTVGQGGMGAVYKAVHLLFDEIRALKVIAKDLAGDPMFVKRFKHEAVITRKLQHPNAVRVDDIDESDDGRPFIVMEFIEGKSLKRVIESEGPLPVPRVCLIIKQVAAALDAAHELGMVHRDIKPDNIVLIDTPGGEQAKVLDFGIAKLKEGRTGETAALTLTGTGVVIGTPQYMSPEQAMGKRGDELDGRSDLYSLGIVMYQMLSGESPFKADTTMEMLLAHMQMPARPIQALRPDLQIPDAIAAVVMKCLEKKTEDRPSSAAVLIEELERAEKQTAAPRAPAKVGPSTAPLGSETIAGRPRVETVGARTPRQPETRPHQQEVPPQPALQAPQESGAVARGRSWKVWGATATASVLVIVAIGAWHYSGTRGSSPNTFEENKSGVASAPGSGDGTAGKAEHDGKNLDPGAGAGSPVGVPLPSHHRVGEPATTSASAKSSLTERNRQPGGVANPSPTKPVASKIESGERQKRIRSAATEGDFFYDNGDYERAIKSYQEGLTLDPTNLQLKNKMLRTRNASAAERQVKP
jgi:serine/threonine protein kinase